MKGLTQIMNRNILRNLSYGVYIVTTMDGERPVGCVANSAMQITSEPPTLAVSINHNNYTHGCIEKEGKFALNIVTERTNPSVIGTFGYSSSKDTDKFAQAEYEMTEGLPIVKDTCGYIVCKVISKFETSTHTIFLGEIIEGEVFGEDTPMTYAYYHKVIKGSSPKNAPTYIPEETGSVKEEKQTKKYVCEVCGYTYEGEEIPEDYKCPICGVGKDKFKQIS